MKFIKKITEKILPVSCQLPLRLYYQRITKKIDFEILYLNKILIKKRRFIDIGSNVGIYSYFFYNKFNKIESFEPLSEITYRLNTLDKKKLKIHNVALSNNKGFAQIYIPIINNELTYPLSSLLIKHKPFAKKKIKINTLDNYNFEEVDLIKIDVEGNEKNIILGGLKTIENNNPAILCEIEQRHISFDMNGVFQLFYDLDYEGFYMNKKKLTSIKYFSYSKNQKPYLNKVDNINYINNFIFLSKKRKNII